ncbi:MAG TPA: hypothetical protein VHD56_09600 [Tepidisphaeraceae bacterium]|nr:hypothetical protein [Tepidisphaeraceae bacterium]
MFALSCCADTFKSLSRAAAKSASARLRQLGIGSTHPRWSVRAEICERCPMRIIHKGISYCGNPFLQEINRDPSTGGCGCPTIAKAKDPDEHCPLDTRHRPAQSTPSACNCKWCSLDGRRA